MRMKKRKGMEIEIEDQKQPWQNRNGAFGNRKKMEKDGEDENSSVPHSREGFIFQR